MEDTDKKLDKAIEELEDKIMKSGEFIKSITDDCFQNSVIDGTTKQLVASTPTELADEIMYTAKDLQQYAIQYETLINLDKQN